MACELRFDRAARCFQRLALRGLTDAGNVGLIAGDAQNALENHLKKGSVYVGEEGFKEERCMSLTSWKKIHCVSKENLLISFLCIVV